MGDFDVDRMPVYRLARQLNVSCGALARRIERKRLDLAGQLARAAASVPANICEGAGEHAPGEKARIYRIARRSATECAGLLDAVVDCGAATEDQTAPLKLLAARVTAQLVLLGRAMDLRAQNEKAPTRRKRRR